MKFIALRMVLCCAFVGAALGMVALPRVATTAFQSGDSTEVLEQLTAALSAAKAEKRPERTAEIYAELSDFHLRYGHVDSALFCLNQAESIYTKLGDKLAMARTYLSLKEIYSLKASYLESMELVYSALEIYEEEDNERGIAKCYAHLADLLYYSDRLEPSIAYSNKAILIQKKLNLPLDLAASYFSKSCAELFLEGRLDSALASINAALAIYDQLGERDLLYIKAINWRGNVYKYLERYDDALADYRQNLRASLRTNTKHYEMVSYANIGHVQLMQEKYAEALPNNLKAIAIMKETGDTRNMWENCMHVATAYEHLGQADSALKYQKLYVAGFEGYMQSVIKRMETEAEVKYETRKKNEKITTQATELAAQQELEKLYASIAVLLLALLAILFWGYRKRRQRNKALRALNLELDAKNHQNELLMKEIHHRVKNNLEMVKSLLALQSAKLTDSASKEAIRASQDRVQSMGIIHQKLYLGNNLDRIEMKDYFENLADEIRSGYHAEEHVQIICDMEPIELNVDMAIPIGLIVNELISNSLKYAFPRGTQGRITVSMQQASDGLHLCVSDDGTGMTEHAPPQGTGFGSQLIDLLTRQLNGVLCRENSTGTTVKIHFHTKTSA